VTRWVNGSDTLSVNLQDVHEHGIRHLSLDKLAEEYVRHEVLTALHARILDNGEDIKKLDCGRCGLMQCELGVLLADSTRGPGGDLVLTQRGIDVVQGAVERMRLHLAVLLCQLDLDEVCRVTGADRVALEARLPAWRSLLALGA
jgi:hypothetical protein